MKAGFFNMDCYHYDFLDVNDGNRIHYELSGNPNGVPVVFLHGGPGAGLPPAYQRFFNPDIFHIIGFDQRGAGRSLPKEDFSSNSLQALVNDIEALRTSLAIDKWLVFGGSWGATLALIYAIQCPQAVSQLVLRGVFLARQQDTHWFLDKNGGAAQLFPEYYDDFTYGLSNNERTADLLLAKYWQRLTSTNSSVADDAVRRWYQWEECLSRLEPTQYAKKTQKKAPCSAMRNLAQLECYYLMNQCFIPENYILENCSAISNISGKIIHGRYDAVCAVSSALALHKAWPTSTLEIVPSAGHSLTEVGISKALSAAMETIAEKL